VPFHDLPFQRQDGRRLPRKPSEIGHPRQGPVDSGLGADDEFPPAGQHSRHAEFPHAFSDLFAWLVYGSLAGSVPARKIEPAYLQPCFETSLAEGVKAMVLEGHGVGWLPETMVRHELETKKRLVRAGGSQWDIEFEVRIFRPISRLPKPAERLWSLLAKRNPSVTQFF
jgi:DNA-binding transcriptional LysR family regulator